MLNSTFDLITLAAASNSLVAFCFCNLIIAILLVGSSKPSSDINEEKPTPLPGIALTKKSVVDDSINACHSFNMNGAAPKDVAILEKSSFDDETVINDFEESPDGEDESHNDEDDELRRRVEEFIDKVNRGWRAEKLRMYAPCHS